MWVPCVVARCNIPSLGLNEHFTHKKKSNFKQASYLMYILCNTRLDSFCAFCLICADGTSFVALDSRSHSSDGCCADGTLSGREGMGLMQSKFSFTR